MSPADVAHLATRALDHLWLALFPAWASPVQRELPPVQQLLAINVALVALLAFAFFSVKVLWRHETRLFRAGSFMLWVGVLVAIVVAWLSRTSAVPPVRVVSFVAPWLWGGLACLVAGLVLKRAASAKRAAIAAGSVIALALAQGAFALPWIRSVDQSYWRAIQLDGENQRALDAVSDKALRRRRYDELEAIADRCLAMHPQACACRELKADAVLHLSTQRSGEAKAMLEPCAARAHMQGINAEALIAEGDLAGAERSITRGFELGGDKARLYYARSLLLFKQGQLREAKLAAAQSIAERATADAALLSSQLDILLGDFASASQLLEKTLREQPEDARATYNLALIADKRGDFNGAREGYLRSLRLDPTLSDARYNLAMLTSRAGIKDEAQHHARKFRATWPTDPRGETLAKTVGL